MYNWIDDRKLSGSRNLPSISFIPKNLNTFIRSRNNHWSSFNQLPVIKEEEGNSSEEEIELRNFLVTNPPLSEGYQGKYGYNVGSSGPRRREREGETKASPKLPPLMNINCLMNVEVKQSQQIWDTSFGRRLMTRNGMKNDAKQPKLKDDSSPKAEALQGKKGNAKFGNGQSFSHIKPLGARRNSIQDRHNKNGGGDREEVFSRVKNDRRKGKKLNKDVKVPCKKTTSGEKPLAKINSELKTVKSTEKQAENSTTLLSRDASTVSSFSKNQHFLSECVKNILDKVSNEITCEHCDEKFSHVDDLLVHAKTHDDKKEVCLLCDKVFYSPNDFIQHLLTHEGVDKFSCKKCKKYFPTLKKYQQHYKENHFVPSETAVSLPDVEYVKKWLPKYECKRCKVEFDSEEAQRAHKRNHIKMDLTGAYLLTPKTI